MVLIVIINTIFEMKQIKHIDVHLERRVAYVETGFFSWLIVAKGAN